MKSSRRLPREEVRRPNHRLYSAPKRHYNRIMTDFAVITAVGGDRVGIVDEVTNAFVDQRCNIEESRMAVLGGEFAMILLVSGAAEDIAELRRRIERTSSELGLSMTIKPTKPTPTPSNARPYLLESISLDEPGIVHAVTSILRKYGVNIEDLETETTSAPWTGAAMFVMKSRISIPASVSVGRLKDEIEELAGRRDLDIKMEPIIAAPT